MRLRLTVKPPRAIYAPLGMNLLTASSAVISFSQIMSFGIVIFPRVGAKKAEASKKEACGVVLSTKPDTDQRCRRDTRF
jgi:hypothetical protein